MRGIVTEEELLKEVSRINQKDLDRRIKDPLNSKYHIKKISESVRKLWRT